MLGRAKHMGKMNDAKLGLMLGKKLLRVDFLQKERAAKGVQVVVPVGSHKVVNLDEYKRIQKLLAGVFATDQEPEQRLYRP